MNWAEIENADDDQLTFEAFYFMKLGNFLEITPDFQYIKDPALNPGKDSITIYGLRVRAVW